MWRNIYEPGGTREIIILRGYIALVVTTVVVVVVITAVVRIVREEGEKEKKGEVVLVGALVVVVIVVVAIEMIGLKGLCLGFCSSTVVQPLPPMYI